MVRVSCSYVKLWDLSGYSENSNIQEAYLPKTIVHPRFDRLTALKTVYPLTSIA